MKKYDRETDGQALRSRWVFKIKTADALITKYKARLVACGYTQIEGVHYTDTYAPTLSYSVLRLILAYGLQCGFTTTQHDVSSAFLIPELPEAERIFMSLPSGMPSPGNGNKPLLMKALYGLKQSAHLWSECFKDAMIDIGLAQVPECPCVFLIKGKNQKVKGILGVFVDDIILCASKEMTGKVIAKMPHKFRLKTLGLPRHLLGIKIAYRFEHGERKPPTQMFLSQPQYITDMLNRYDLANCNPKNTPLPTAPITLDDGFHARNQEEVQAGIDGEFRSKLGSLSFLATCTRPDISAAVNTVAQLSANAGPKAVTYVNHILRYLQSTRTHGILYTRTTGNLPDTVSDFDITPYADSDYAADRSSRRSRSGGIILMAKGPIIWWSRLQKCVTLSTSEAELEALVAMVKECIWLKALLNRLQAYPKNRALIIRQDNTATLAIAKYWQLNARNKYYSIKHKWIGEISDRGIVGYIYCPTGDMIADGLTKSLSKVLLQRSREHMSVVRAPTFARALSKDERKTVHKMLLDVNKNVSTALRAARIFSDLAGTNQHTINRTINNDMMDVNVMNEHIMP